MAKARRLPHFFIAKIRRLPLIPNARKCLLRVNQHPLRTYSKQLVSKVRSLRALPNPRKHLSHLCPKHRLLLPHPEEWAANVRRLLPFFNPRKHLLRLYLTDLRPAHLKRPAAKLRRPLLAFGPRRHLPRLCQHLVPTLVRQSAARLRLLPLFLNPRQLRIRHLLPWE